MDVFGKLAQVAAFKARVGCHVREEQQQGKKYHREDDTGPKDVELGGRIRVR